MYSFGRRYRSTSHLPSTRDNVNNGNDCLSSPLPTYHEAINNNFLTSDRDRSLILDVDVSRNFNDVRKKRTRRRNPNQRENTGPEKSGIESEKYNNNSLERGMHRYSSMSDLPSQANKDAYVPYGNKQNQLERTKWLAYAKTIKPRKARVS